MTKIPFMVGVAVILSSIPPALTRVALGLERVDFQNEIQPILQQHCYRCHGPSEQQAGLRLDRKINALAAGDSGAPLVPGDRNSSLLYQRVAGLGDLDQMPPDSEPLSPALVERIGRWIDEGARWTNDESTAHTHWSYLPPTRPNPPATQDTDWPNNEIDHFVLARLEQSGLQPSLPADRARLLRRVYLDLIGLPPTVKEIDAFLADTRPQAYETVVDRLLASQHYGERWAVPWLDAARYADSNGYQADQYREVWPYRDWVINALNNDMPFDQFTIEQLAGDLLEGSTTDQKIATGFHRQTTCNVEAGVDPEENRVNQIIDRVNTTGTVWLGTTLQCAQCHDHKYDPFDQRDYYRLFAYFNNTPLEVKHTTATTYDFFGPKLDVPLPENSTAEQRRLKKEFQVARDTLERYLDDLVSRQAAWEQQQRERLAAPESRSALWQSATVIEFQSSGGASHQVLEDGSILISGARPDKDTYTIQLSTKLSEITALRLEALTHGSLPGGGPGRHHPQRPNFVLNELTLQLGNHATSAGGELIGLTNPWADYSQASYDVAGAIDGKPDTAWAIHQEFHQPHVAAFELDQPLRIKDETTLLVTLEQNHGGCRTLGRVRISFSGATPPPRSASADERPPPEIAEILMIDPTGRTEDQQDQVVGYYRAEQPEYHRLTQQVANLKQQLGDAMSATTLVMVEMDNTRESRILKRGDFRKPSDQVPPGTPAVLHPVSHTDSGDRLELARWLVNRDNPLTARVTVNRWWSQIFGQGIVRTTEDFGTQGERPSHPQLLDWLSLEFMDSRWSMKHIHKLIVMSATYQQSSRLTPALLEQDPKNRLLARGPRFRLGAEAIRDNGLKISGLLTAKLGGPPVYPPQPDGIWRHVGRNPPEYRVETGEDRYRRGLYVVWRRSAPYPSFVNFDAPDRAACVVERSRVNTPLQALTLLNDEAYVEMAWAFAARIAQRGSRETSEAIRFAFRSCVARQPTEEEVHELLAVFHSEHQRLHNDSETTNLMIGDYPRPADATPAEFAAWFYVASILLNLDETITKG